MLGKDPGYSTERVLWLLIVIRAAVDGERYQSGTQSKDSLKFNGKPQALLPNFAYACGSPLNDFMDHLL